ncbi:epithelial cell-transforming sequence 2 oncogene-like isoform X2 [Protopterus annectens]|uniref:epithelial cell-transforming sequence 2 oncogene-like isoform X2 n=1 Tax=Protopterus annectens TaxID=7888 RepID=UPI001CF999A4|nr:epithelial cell-transforming sequence 2 oncogene-like isoform X2 [Protopterus annectens]
MASILTSSLRFTSPHSIKRWQLESIGVTSRDPDMASQDATMYAPQNVCSQTRFSAWTPITDKAANLQLFQERVNLVCHWFDMWTDKQRKQFIHMILTRCSKSQLRFTRDWFVESIPVTKVDFTTVLPRFISLYIFSFLNPKDLCAAAQVNWHWRFLSEQDCLWMPKCTKMGWFLPYTPSVNEYGSWKRHYVACATSLDYLTPREASEIYGTLNEPKQDSEEQEERMKEKLLRKLIQERLAQHKRNLIKSRPPWNAGTWNPAVLASGLQTSASIKSQHQAGLTAALLLIRNEISKPGLTLSKQIFEDSKSLSYLNNTKEKELVQMSLRSLPKRKNMAGTSSYPALSYRQCNEVQKLYSSPPPLTQPRIMLISSRIPAYEMVVNSVKVNTIPLTYDYTGLSLESLLLHVENALQGQQAKSIGIVTDGDPGEINLLQGYRIDAKSVLNPPVREFWEKLGSCVIPKEQRGSIDIFVPLAASDMGMELLSQLSHLSDVSFNCPAGIVTGSYQHILGSWLGKSDKTAIPLVYFNEAKLLVWCRLAEVLEESLKLIRKQIKPYMSDFQRDICSRIIGQFMFDSMSMAKIEENKEVAQTLTEALSALASAASNNPLEFLTVYLMGKVKHTEGLKPSQTFLTESNSEAANLSAVLKEEDCEEGHGNIGGVTYHTAKSEQTFQELNRKLLREVADKRTAVAREMLTSEKNYVQLLTAVKDLYVSPLKAALASNRAILGVANLQIIFSDILDILDINRQFLEELKLRLHEWNTTQCLGDVFTKFSTRLSTYTNFFNNYTTALKTLDKCRESIPQFRAFLKRHDKTYSTKMMSLQEILLCPSKRFEEYVTLLYALRLHTPPDHSDRPDLSAAIEQLKQYRDYIRQLKMSMDRDNQMAEAQHMIQGCPNLLEGNRYLIRLQNVALLQCQDETISHPLRYSECISSARPKTTVGLLHRDRRG